MTLHTYAVFIMIDPVLLSDLKYLYINVMFYLLQFLLPPWPFFKKKRKTFLMLMRILLVLVCVSMLLWEKCGITYLAGAAKGVVLSVRHNHNMLSVHNKHQNERSCSLCNSMARLSLISNQAF